MNKPVVVFEVSARQPDRTMLLDEFIEWQKAESARMSAELSQQIRTFLHLLAVPNDENAPHH